MVTDSGEWFRQAQYDLGTAEVLASAGYPPRTGEDAAVPADRGDGYSD
jgi:hypothetical protein